MDDFNNFFDDQRDEQPMHTPVYHTPEPRNRNKLNAATIICIVVAAVMCVVVLVNVIVLASLRQSIAEEYAASISASMREQYKNAIDESLSDTNVVDEVTKAATEQALKRLQYAVGQYADEECAPSVARLYMYTESSNQYGVASGFLITNTDESGTAQRYLLTNAHCVRYAAQTRSGGFGFGAKYSWASYKRIVAIFDGEDKEYELEVVAYGAYDDTEANLQAENSQPDIAVLRIKGNQPDNQNHPALKLITSDKYVGRGDPVALIGNPEGIGNKNTITSGSVSQVELTLSDWGAGTFIMTDAAVNSGNSGGPMVNILGVVGIVESKLADDSIDNMGFALSADTIRSFLSWAATNNTLNTDLSSVFQNL